MNRTSLTFLLLLAVLCCPASPVMAQEEIYDGFDVPYVPTPENVVDRMLRMACVTASDVIYDPGCGDGRIVITAAKEYGAHGVGIDIDPERIAESRLNARAEGVADRALFWEGDLFEVDIRSATVMTLYLLTDVNIRLRPRLFSDLRPGARIVSHNFSMGEWEADRSVDVEGRYSTHTIYLWIIPANVSGRWEARTGGSGDSFRLDIEQRFQHIMGTAHVNGEVYALVDPALKGDRITFSVSPAAPCHLSGMTFTGIAAGETLEGRISGGSDDNGSAATWRAERVPGTERTIGE